MELYRGGAPQGEDSAYGTAECSSHFQPGGDAGGVEPGLDVRGVRPEKNGQRGAEGGKVRAWRTRMCGLEPCCCVGSSSGSVTAPRVLRIGTSFTWIIRKMNFFWEKRYSTIGK
ncbi:hypothetical protein R5R35_009223 [Gryllus longicercus]|uniref:Uncharacterized protein n=1 Tax=Gryllus longicercus TaxID=2509291 RepID=A0AAN9W1S2_9ORTH